MNREMQITSMLLKLGNQPNNKGFAFLRTGVMLCIGDMELCRSLNKGLYPLIAHRFSTSPAAVERNVRFSINSGWQRRDKQLAEIIFGNTLQSERDIPTNSLYFAALAEWAALQAQ